MAAKASVSQGDLSERNKGVGFNCSEYAAHIDEWTTCRIVADGAASVKAAGPRFLPMLSEQDSAAYAAYKLRANFFGATGRTISAVIGMMFQKPAEFKLPENKMVDALKESLSIDGVSASAFVHQVAAELITTGRVGVLADLPRSDGAPTTEAPMPYLSMYRAEAICNWRTEVRKGRVVLTMLVLEEITDVPNGQFESVQQVQRRVLELLTDSGGTQFVQVTMWTWKQTGNKWAWIPDKPIVPTVRGKMWTEIPFTIFNVDDLTMKCDTPVILDLVEVNLSHYRNSADLEHGRHFTGLPTPYACGFEQKGPNPPKMKIGSTTAWVSDNANAKVGFLEFAGQGLTSLEKALTEKQDQMSILGARLLSPDKAQVEAADTQKVRHSSENNVVRSMAETMEEGFTKIFKTLLEWMAIGGDVSVLINKEYMDDSLDSATVKELVGALQTGAISWETFFYNMQRGGYIQDGITADDEKTRIEQGTFAPISAEQEMQNAIKLAQAKPAPIVGDPNAADPNKKDPKGGNKNQPVPKK